MTIRTSRPTKFSCWII